jgi:RNA polymerase sigma-70 factor (ECF subfamily)
MAVRQSVEGGVDLDALYRSYAPRVQAVARRRVRDRHLVDDVVQETFLRAHRAQDRFDPARPAWPWLATIASNVCTDLQRRHSSGEVVSAITAFERPGREDVEPAHCFGAGERRRGVADALASVPERQRRVLVMKDHLGWRADEIAAHEDLHVEAVKGLLKRARAGFRQAYAELAEQRGLWGGAAALGTRLRQRWRTAVARAQSTSSWAWATSLPCEALGTLLGATIVAGVAVGTASPAPSSSPTSASAAVRLRSPEAVAGATMSTEHGHGAITAPASPGEPPGADLWSVSPQTPLGVGAGASNKIERGRDITITTKVFAKVPGGEPKGFHNTLETPCDMNEIRRAACAAIDHVPDLNQ